MIIIDFILACYFLYLRKKEHKGYEAAIYLASMFLTLNLFAFFSWLIYTVGNKPIKIAPLTVGIVVIAVGFLLIRVLERHYYPKYETILTLSTKIPKVIGYLLPLFHYIISVLLVVFSITFYTTKFFD